MPMPRRDSSGKFIKKGAVSGRGGESELQFDASELDGLFAVFIRAQSTSVDPLLDAIGQQQEDSARRRIAETKVSPSGTPWAPWSAKYAATRGSQHSLLRGEGDLEDSLGHKVVGKLGMFGFAGAAVDVGSNLEYAMVMLYGSQANNTPARPYLDTDGNWADPRDKAEVGDIIVDFLAELLKKQ